MTFNNDINKVFLDTFRDFSNDYASKNPETEQAKLYEAFKIYINIEEPVTKKKETKPRTKKVLDIEERCVAKTKIGEQCKGSRKKDGVESELCTLHNRIGVSFGRVINDFVEDGQEVNSDLDQEKKPDVEELQQEIKQIKINEKKDKSKKISKEFIEEEKF